MVIPIKEPPRASTGVGKEGVHFSHALTNGQHRHLFKWLDGQFGFTLDPAQPTTMLSAASILPVPRTGSARLVERCSFHESAVRAAKSGTG